MAVIERLSVNPEGPATTALVGRDGRRLRVSDWRVLYRVDLVAGHLTVLPRGRAYRD